MRRVTSFMLVALASLLVIGSWASNQNQSPRPVKVERHVRPSIAPEIPKAKRTDQLVFLEHADRLFRLRNDDYMILVGNVEFSKGPMHMFTDSAHFYDATGSFDAFGNVRMEQGDTLFIFGDELNYDGETEIANLFGYDGKPVRLINRDVKLETDIFTYDMVEELGYYTTGGVLTDKQNRLESTIGEYSPATKEANFYDNVILTSRRPNDELTMANHELYYSTLTHLAIFHVPTLITNKDGKIESTDGVYNTETNLAELYAHSLVTTNKGSTLEGDTLFYDRNKGIGEAWGNMALVDSTRELRGNYGFYNELVDSAFVTGHAVAMEFSKGDTLYIHSRYITSVLRVDSLTRVLSVDTIRTPVLPTLSDSIPILGENVRDMEVTDISEDFNLPPSSEISTAPVTQENSEIPMLPDIPTDTVPKFNITLIEHTEQYADSTHIVSAWPRVRMYRTDMQGLCDSLVFTQADSMVRMYHHPIVWSEDRQIFGNTILLHVNDSTVESAVLPDFGFMAQLIEDQFYNQLTGKSMKAWFEDGKLHRTLVEGSVEGIVYPEENDSTINKLVNFKTANLEGFFEDQNMKRMKMWAQTSGEAIPLYLAKYTDLHLPQFKWYEGLRPLSPEDIFVIPQEMEELMADIPPAADIPIPPAPSIEDSDYIPSNPPESSPESAKPASRTEEQSVSAIEQTTENDTDDESEDTESETVIAVEPSASEETEGTKEGELFSPKVNR